MAQIMDWQDKFKAYVLRTNFMLALTRPQLELLCAVADDVEWDRFSHGGGGAPPANLIASGGALEKRGLIERRTKRPNDKPWRNVFELRSLYELTLAGEIVVELLKCTGLFIEQDNAIYRKAHKA